MTRDVQRVRSVRSGDHGLVQVGEAPGAAALGGGGELGRFCEIAVVVRCLRRHLVNVVGAAIAEAQLVAHHDTEAAQPIKSSAANIPKVGIVTNGHGASGGGRERTGRRVEPKRAGQEH